MSFVVGILLAWYVVFLFSATCHEAAHAWAARLGGDSTAYEGGQVSLDPFPHIRREPVGMIVVPLLSFVLIGYSYGWQNAWMIGWASAPYNPLWAARHPRRHALMSLAGPMANFVIAGTALLLLKLMLGAGVLQVPAQGLAYTNLVEAARGNYGSTLGAVAMVLGLLLILNLLLGLFNLLPIPPLDGGSVAEGLGPPPVQRIYATMREQPLFGMIGLVVAWQIFPHLWFPVVSVALHVLYS